MTASELIEKLKTYLPLELATDLVNNFMIIKSDLSTGTLERSAPGKFIETVVQILQFLEKGHYEQKPKVDYYLKTLESRSSEMPDDLRVTLSRIARANYTLRSKHGIVHKGDINPNVYDLKLLFSSSQWIVSELTRYLLSSDIDVANKLIEYIQIPVNSLIEDFGDKRLVLHVGTAEEELLSLLFHYYPQAVQISQIKKDMNRRAKSTIFNSIRNIYKNRYIEGTHEQGYKLTTLGYQFTLDVIRKNFSNYDFSVITTLS